MVQSIPTIGNCFDCMALKYEKGANSVGEIVVIFNQQNLRHLVSIPFHRILSFLVRPILAHKQKRFTHPHRDAHACSVGGPTPAQSGYQRLLNRKTNASSIERPTPPQSRDPRLLNRKTNASSIERPTPPQSRDPSLLNR